MRYNLNDQKRLLETYDSMSRWGDENLDEEINVDDIVEISSDHAVHPGKIATVLKADPNNDTCLVKLDNGIKAVIGRRFLAIANI